MDGIIASLLVVILLLAGLSLFLFLYYWKINKAIDELLQKGKVKDLRDIFFSHIEKTKEIDAILKGALEKIKSLEDVSKITFQKIGIVRFNPFLTRGGNQSFVIALLDSKNSGFVISSLFAEEGSRMYAKSVVNAKSDHTLSKEELEAIQKAIKSHDS